jgi:hypothetical protein
MTRPKARLTALVAFGLASLAASGADAAILKRVHSGTTTVTSASAATVTLELPDASKAFVVCTASTTDNDSNNRVTCVLSDNTLTIDGGSSITNSAVVVSWHVAEFLSGVSVQRGTASFAANATSVTPSIAAVDCSKSFVVLAGEQTNAGDSTTNDQEFTFRAILGTFGSPCAVTAGTTTSTFTIGRHDSSSNAATVAWQVVTMEGATVLSRGATTIFQGNTTRTVTVASSDPTVAFVVMSRTGRSANAGVEGLYQVIATFSGSGPPYTEVTFGRGGSNSNTSNHDVDIAYEVVRLDDGGSVQAGNTYTSSTTSTTMGGAGNIAAVDRSATVPIFAVGGGTTSSTDLVDTAWRAAFPSITQLQFTRAGSPNVDAAAYWFVVSFYKCVNSRLCSVAATGGNASATVSWSPIYDPQCASSGTPTACQALVVRDTSPITWTPSNGTSYTVGNQPAGGPSTMRVAFNGTGQSVSQSGLTNGTRYYYRVYPRINGTTSYITDSGMTQAISQVDVTPSASLAWSYMTTGGSTLSAPITGNGRVYVASNGSKMVALDSATGVQIATPVITHGAVQSYLAWLPLTAGGEAVIAGDQSGWLTRMDGETGLPVWSRKMAVDSGGFIQANLSAQIVAYANLGSPPCDGGAFGGAYALDQLYVASRNNSRTDNKVWAVPVDTDGQTSLSWTFDPAASIDRSAGQSWVDYCNNRLWVATGGGSGGTQKSLWVIDTVTGAEVTTTINAGSGVGVLGDLTNSSPSLSADLSTLWVGNASGRLYAIDAAAATPSLKYSLQLAGSTPTITGFVWEDWTTPGRLYVPVTVGGSGGVWCVQDSGAALTACSDWATNPRLVTAGAVTQPMVLGTAIFFPGSDGTVYQLNTSDGQLYLGTGTPFTVEAGTALGGLSTEDGTQLYVGTSGGRTYRINLTGGNLP